MITAGHQPGNAPQNHFIGAHAAFYAQANVLRFQIQALLNLLALTLFKDLHCQTINAPRPNDKTRVTHNGNQGLREVDAGLSSMISAVFVHVWRLQRTTAPGLLEPLPAVQSRIEQAAEAKFQA